MDKKNTMLLTVIAVATLLVAVVGATFAYFSLTTAGSASTTVTTKTGKIPTITYNNGATDNLYLTVTTNDMAEEHAGQNYYAVATNAEPSKVEKYHNILQISIASGDEETKYTCSGSIKMEIDGEMADLIEPTDVTLGFKNLDGNEGTDTVDLAGLKAKDKTDSRTFSFDMTGNGDKTIQAYVMLTNRSAGQNNIAGKTLNITLSAENVSCRLKEGV